MNLLGTLNTYQFLLSIRSVYNNLYILKNEIIYSSVCMDAWLEGEEENSLRVLQSSVIGIKHKYFQKYFV